MIYENMAESIDDEIPAMSIPVYTDTTCSETIQIDKKSNDYSIYSANNFKLPSNFAESMFRGCINLTSDISNIWPDEWTSDNPNLLYMLRLFFFKISFNV